jgi:hypothetical protein
MSRPRVSATRLLLGAAGVGLILVGARQLLGTSLPHLADIMVFLVGGVLGHDLVLAPLVVLAGALLVPLLPTWGRSPVVVGLVILLSVTLTAVPVLGRFAAKRDDPGLLNRPYGMLWVMFALLVLAVVVAACLLRRRRSVAAGRAR